MDINDNMEEGAWFRSQNPLENNLILNKVAQQLDYRSLKTIRRVCIEWNNHILPLFRKRTRLNITGAYSAEDSRNVSAEVSMKYFVDAFNSPPTASTVATRKVINALSTTTTTTVTTITFPLLQIDNIVIHLPCHVRNPFITEWMTSYGKYINTITIGNDMSDYNEIRDKDKIGISTLQSLLKSCSPNLKLLRIKPDAISFSTDLEIKEDPRGLSIETLELGFHPKSNTIYIGCEPGGFVKHSQIQRAGRLLFSIAKCIRNLKIINPQKSQVGFGLTTLFSTPPIPTTIIESLIGLDFVDYKVDPAALETLCDMNFKNLKSIALGQLEMYSTECLISLQRFISHFGPKLETLHLWQTPGNHFEKTVIEPVDCPLEQEFKYLKLLMVSVNNWTMGCIDFVRKLPSLEVLHLSAETSTGYYKWWPPLSHDFRSGPTKKAPTAKLENLFKPFTGGNPNKRVAEFSFPCRMSNIFDLQKILELMPNLRIIEIWILAEILELALSAMSSLRNLQKLKLGVDHEPGDNKFLVKGTNRLYYKEIVKQMPNFTVSRKKLLLSVFYGGLRVPRRPKLPLDEFVNGVLNPQSIPRLGQDLVDKIDLDPEIVRETYELHRKQIPSQFR